MDIFQILSDDIFRGCNVEAYSYWIKKRVTVFEYDVEGKVKLGIEPIEEQGALVYLDGKECGFCKIVRVFSGLFLYMSKTSFLVVGSFVVLDEGKLDFGAIFEGIEQFRSRFRGVEVRLMILTDRQLTEREMEDLGKLCRFRVFPRSGYIGREAEEFLKGKD